MRNHNIHRRILQTCFTDLKKNFEKIKKYQNDVVYKYSY